MHTTKRPHVPLTRGSSYVWSGTSDDEPSCKSEEVPFRLTLLFLGSIGVVPCTWKKPHLPSLHLTKSTFVIGFTISVAMYICLFRAITFFIDRMLTEDIPLYIKIIISIYFAFSLFSSAFVSIWIDAPAIHRAIKIWMRLSELYLELTKNRPKARWQMAERISIALVVLVPLPGLGLIKHILPDLRLTYEYMLPLAYIAMIVFPLAVLWVGYCSYLAVYAKDVNQEMAQSVQQNSLTSEKLRIYRDIWIQMKAFSDTISTINNFFLLLVLALPTLVIIAFGFIIYLQAGMYFISSMLLFFCIVVVLFIGYLGVATDFVVEEVKSLYSSILSLQNLSSIKSGAQSQIINLYLIENLRPVNPTFSGFVAITKAVTCSILSAVTVNIVILAQLTQPR